MKSPSMQAQEISTFPQLDGPRSLLMRDPIGRRIHEVSRPAEQDSCQGDAYVQWTTTTRGREYPEEDGNNYGSRRPHRNQRPPDRGRYLNQGGRPLTKEDTLTEDPLEEDILIGMGDPLEEEDTLAEDTWMEMDSPLVMEDLLVMEDSLDLLGDRDQQALKDYLDQ